MWFLRPRAEIVCGGQVHLRLPRLQDSGAWRRLRLESRAFVEPWEPTWRQDHLSEGSFRTRVRRARRLAAERRCWSFLVFRSEDECLVGGLSLTDVLEWPSCQASLGYWIGQPYARRGYMRDAIGAVEKFAEDRLGLGRLAAACVAENEASRRLLLSCGYRREGFARSLIEVNGVWRDHELYAKVVPDRRDPHSEGDGTSPAGSGPSAGRLP